MNLWRKKLQHIFPNQFFLEIHSFWQAKTSLTLGIKSPPHWREHSPHTHSHINCTPTQVALKSMNFQQNMNGILNFFSQRIRIRIIFGLKNCPNTNTNIIRFEKITRIRIRILFGLKKSTEYEYEYYSV